MSTDRLSRWGGLYVGSVTLLGACAIAQSAYALYAVPMGWNWFVLAILTLISGSATVKLPSVPATISVSETFVFTSVLLFGPAAGTITVALDALVISFWSYRRGHPIYKIIFNVSAVSLALWLSSHLYYALSPYEPLFYLKTISGKVVNVQIERVLFPLLGFTVVYYALNTGLISFAIALERRGSPIK